MNREMSLAISLFHHEITFLFLLGNLRSTYSPFSSHSSLGAPGGSGGPWPTLILPLLSHIESGCMQWPQLSYWQTWYASNKHDIAIPFDKAFHCDGVDPSTALQVSSNFLRLIWLTRNLRYSSSQRKQPIFYLYCIQFHLNEHCDYQTVDDMTYGCVPQWILAMSARAWRYTGNMPKIDPKY